LTLVTVSNVPDILDVRLLIELVKGLGVKVEKLASDTYTFQADDVNLDYLDSKEFNTKSRKIRGSVMLIGPLLARFGKANLPQPGGDKIGRRRLDAHFIGFKKLGAEFKYDDAASQRVQQLFTMLLANHIWNNSVNCSITWAQKYQVSGPIV